MIPESRYTVLTHNTECLKTLRLHNSRYKLSQQYEHTGTCEWFTKSPEYSDWLSTEGSGLFFIEGKPGSGKTTLLRFLTKHLKLPANGIVAKFFYSHMDGELGRSHKNMLQCLLHEILKKDESLFVHFQQAYRNLKDSEADQSTKAWEYGELKAVLKACLRHPLKRTFFLIIDAIDESDDGERADMVDLLREISRPAKPTGCVVKVLFASRPMNEIRHVNIPAVQRIRLQEKNGKDIEVYTDHLVKKRVFTSYGDGNRKEIKDYIDKHADGVFLWVRVVGRELEKCCQNGMSTDTVLTFLKSLPKEIEGYYEFILQRLKDGEDDARDGTRVLQFCLFSHRDVELLELRDALGIRQPLSSFDLAPSLWEKYRPVDIRSRLTSCVGGFVEIKSISDSQGRVSGKSLSSDVSTC